MKKLNYLLFSICFLQGCSTSSVTSISSVASRDIAAEKDPSCLSAINAFLGTSNRASSQGAHLGTQAAARVATASVTPASTAKNLEPVLGQRVQTISSGVQINGDFKEFKKINDQGELYYYGTKGPTQLLYDGRVILGQDINHHPHGFSSPLGNLKGVKKAIEDLTLPELKKLKIEIGQEVRIEYESGVIVQGQLKEIISRNGKNIIFIFENKSAEVSAPDGSLLFERNWGTFDMVVGKSFVANSDNASKIISSDIISLYRKPLYDKNKQQETIKIFKEHGPEFILSELKKKGFRPVRFSEIVSTEELWEKVARVHKSKGYYGIPLDVGDIGIEHGEYSHALQFYTITKNMTDIELDAFKTIFRRMEESPQMFDQMWETYFKTAGSATANTPRYWRALLD